MSDWGVADVVPLMRSQWTYCSAEVGDSAHELFPNRLCNDRAKAVPPGVFLCPYTPTIMDHDCVCCTHNCTDFDVHWVVYIYFVCVHLDTLCVCVCVCVSIQVNYLMHDARTD